ncbi:MAG: NAD(P)/FAD-dependent oxidoreductase [Actinobacteria bacterium]|nr:NAD(P)/FAD-dependent oxidoreductase [Actinomycetota bacterium]
MGSSNGSTSSTPRVVIAGAGFGGIGLAIRLKTAGIESFTLLEKAEAVGGVWRHNSYPGLTCDVPSHLYSFSFEPKHDWSRRYPRRDEILSYLEHCVDKYGIRPHLRTGVEVASAEFDEDEACWRVQTTDGGELEGDVFVPATGQLGRPKYPGLPGLDRFGGKLFHSAHWEHGYDLRGKRVASLGTGASAIQYLPEIAPLVERLYVFQRSPSWVVPKPDRPYRPRQRALFRALPWLQAISRWIVYWRFEMLILALTSARWLAAPYRAGYARRLEKEIADPELRRKLLPDFPLGCKRVLISNDYLPMLARENVELVTDPIAEVRERAVVTREGIECEVDTIILGTGFAANDFLAPMVIRGLGGRDLNDVWRERDGAEAYLGLAVSGFPNMFMLYGPNTNLGAGSIIFMLESQIEFVVSAVRELARTGARWMDVREEVQEQFNREVQERLQGTVWTAGCQSWYRTESGKVVNNWPGFTFEYRRRTRRPDPADFRLVGSSTGAGAGLQAA